GHKIDKSAALGQSPRVGTLVSSHSEDAQAPYSAGELYARFVRPSCILKAAQTPPEVRPSAGDPSHTRRESQRYTWRRSSPSEYHLARNQECPQLAPLRRFLRVLLSRSVLELRRAPTPTQFFYLAFRDERKPRMKSAYFESRRFGNSAPCDFSV